MNWLTKFSALVLALVMVLGLAACTATNESATTIMHASDPAEGVSNSTVPASDPTEGVSNSIVTYDTVVGYIVDEEGNHIMPITYGDLRPEYLKEGFPNKELREELMDRLYTNLCEVACYDGYTLSEDAKNSYRNLSEAVAYDYEPVNAPGTVAPLYYADIPDEYRMYGFGDEAAKYLINLRHEANKQNLKAPDWVEYSPYYDAICVAPSFVEELLSTANTAVIAWLGDGEPEAELVVENGTSLELYGRFVEETEDGYEFVACYAVENAAYAAENGHAIESEVDVIPCTIEVYYDKDADAFLVSPDLCEETLNNKRRWQGSYTQRLPQTYEDCFVPQYSDPAPVMDIPEGVWKTDYELTCVFSNNCFSDWEGNLVYVEVYNAINKANENDMGCLLLREDGSALWIEDAIFCEAEFDTMSLPYENEAEADEHTVSAYSNLRLWCVKNSDPAVDIVAYVGDDRGWDIS